MEEEDWKNIIDELREQIGNISLERAAARSEVRKTIVKIEKLEKINSELREELLATGVVRNLEAAGE